MSVRLSVLCGGFFAAAAIAAGTATVMEMPVRAMSAHRESLTACALPGLRCAPPDVFLHQREIGPPSGPAFGRADPTMLVSSAWVDLSGGPVSLDIPATGSRFFLVQMLDERDDTIAVADPSTIGRSGARLTLAEPSAEAGSGVVDAKGWVWIVARFAVTDEADAQAVHGLQDALKISRQAAKHP